MDEKPKYWFKTRKYGYGWMPSTWQGWTLTAGHIGLIVAISYFMFGEIDSSEAETSQLLFFYGLIAVQTLVFISLVRQKAPPMKWRWGKKKKEEEKTFYDSK